MGLFKIIGLISGLPIRPTTGRERSRMYQRQANNLLGDQLDAIQNLSQPQQVIQAPSDSRPRGTCPACMEMMLVGASTCPHCHTSGITWPETKVTTEKTLIPPSAPQRDYEEIHNKKLSERKRRKLISRVQSSDYRIYVESESEKLNRIREEKEARKPENLKNYADKVRNAKSKELGG